MIAYSPVRYLIVMLWCLVEHFRHRALRDDISAVRAGAGADVDQIVGGADAVFIVLDHDDGIADGLQTLERADQPGVVALVQADGRLIEHIADADQPAADLRGQADALGFAAGEGGGFAVEREVAEADIDHEPKPGGDFAHDRLGDLLAFLAEPEFVEKPLGVARRSCG